jgi:hypothetical protein
MGQTTYPAAGGYPFSSVPPVNASSVLLDGQLVSSTSYTTTVTGTGGVVLLYSANYGTTWTINSSNYTVSANSTLGVTLPSGSNTVTVASPGYYSPGTSAPTTTLTSWGTTTSAYSNQPAGYGQYGNVPKSNGSGTWLMAVGPNQTSGYTFISYDNGLTFNAGTSPTAGAFCCYYNGYWILNSGNGGQGLWAYSTNGTSWTTWSGPVANCGQIDSVSNGTTTYVYTFSAAGYLYYTASTGAPSTWSWASVAMPSSGTVLYYANMKMIWNGSYFIYNNPYSTSTYGYYCYATSISGGWSYYNWGGSYGQMALERNPNTGYTMATSYSSSQSYYTSGSTATGWTSGTTPTTFISLCYTGNYWWGITGGTSNYWSSNNTTWTGVSSPSGVNGYGFATSDKQGTVVGAPNGNGPTAQTGLRIALQAQLPLSFGMYAGPTTIH